MRRRDVVVMSAATAAALIWGAAAAQETRQNYPSRIVMGIFSPMMAMALTLGTGPV
jgi:hypothetical protein